MNKNNALLSVYDKSGIVEFAQGLVDLGWTIFSSGGTAKVLMVAGLPVTDVATLVGGGAILGHKVVTLSREVHASLLVDPDNPNEMAEFEALGLPFFDLVCVDLYPLTDEIANPNSTAGSVIEKTDIGGPTMLRSAAKGRRIVVSDPNERHNVIQWLKDGQPSSEIVRAAWAADAEALVAVYCLASAAYTSLGRIDGRIGEMVAPCKYGENAWQKPAALFADENNDPLALHRFQLVAGDDLSYNNWVDIDRLLQTVTHTAAGFDRNFHVVPAIAVGVKHGNACGAAYSLSEGGDVDAVSQMVIGDPRSIFGGLVMTNFMVDSRVAEALLHHQSEHRRLLDAVVATSFTAEAIEMLARKKGKCRLVECPALEGLNESSLDSSMRIRYVRGGFLRQPNYTFVLDFNSPDFRWVFESVGGVMTNPDPSDPEHRVFVESRSVVDEGDKRDAILAWAVGCTSNSNTITLVKNGCLIGNGVGQQDRVGGCELAIKRALDSGHDISGAVAYSDSFFPFDDGPAILLNAGVQLIIATFGSIHDDDIVDAVIHRGQLGWQPDAVGRGFFGH